MSAQARGGAGAGRRAVIGSAVALALVAGLPSAARDGSTSVEAAAGAVPGAGVPAAVAPGPPVDLSTPTAAIELIIPTVIDVTRAAVSPGANDASIVLRFTFLITSGWFDAIAPYHPTAVGVSSDLGRRPPEERTDHNRNVAMLHATYHVMRSLLPAQEATWRQMLEAAGLDPDDDSDDLATAVGIGNRAGLAVMAEREVDGMNQLGDHPASLVPGQPYADTTGYQPVNSHVELSDPSRWQPLVVTEGNGIFRVQSYVTPQWAQVAPLSYERVDGFSVPAPSASVPRGAKGRSAYKAQADEVLAVAAALTDEQKAVAELFDDKFRSLGFSTLFVFQSRQQDLQTFVHYDYLVNLAAADAGIAVWAAKTLHDAVRPVTAIGYQYGGESIPGWGGVPGPADPVKAAWTSYLSTADHPEYPSGSAGFCAAHAQASRRFLGTDDLGWDVPVPAGSSLVEPGVVPAADLVLSFPTWTSFEEQCGLSRLYGGVHFRPAIDHARTMTRPIGDLAYDFVQAHIDGDVGAIGP